MRGGMNGRLAGMMALVYAIQGCWWPLLAVHLEDLGISGRGRGWVFATMALACFVTPLWAGQIADRVLPIQRMLGLIFLVGAVFLALIGQAGPWGLGAVFALFLGYWLICAPAYGLSNTLAFRNLDDPARQFGRIRLWGTIGWMLAGWLVALVMWLELANSGPGIPVAFQMGAGVALVFAFYCLRFLPDTPPLDTAPRVGHALAGLDLLRRPSVALFLVVAFAVGLTMPFVYQTIPAYLRQAGLAESGLPLVMSLGQVPEILALAVLPWLHRRLGLRGTLALGAGAWAVEYLVLSAQPPLLVAIAVVPLSGVAIGCFLISGQIFLDGQAPPQRRASMQALHVMITTGLSSLTGNLLAGELMSASAGAASSVFLVPGLINAAAAVVLIAAFRPVLAPRSAEPSGASGATTASPHPMPSQRVQQGMAPAKAAG